jgi:hypothetical protein
VFQLQSCINFFKIVSTEYIRMSQKWLSEIEVVVEVIICALGISRPGRTPVLHC